MRRLTFAPLCALALSCSPIEPPLVDASALPDTTDTQGPYEVGARVSGVRPISSVTLVWHNALSTQPALRVSMAQDTAGVYRGQIPGQGAGALVLFHVEALDNQGDEGDAPPAAPFVATASDAGASDTGDSDAGVGGADAGTADGGSSSGADAGSPDAGSANLCGDEYCFHVLPTP